MERLPYICAADVPSVALLLLHHFHIETVACSQLLQLLRVSFSLKTEPEILSHCHKCRMKLRRQHLPDKILRLHVGQLRYERTLQKLVNSSIFQQTPAFFIGHNVLPGQPREHPGGIFLKGENDRCKPLLPFGKYTSDQFLMPSVQSVKFSKTHCRGTPDMELRRSCHIIHMVSLCFS